MPGGSLAGTLLGMTLFIVMINPINFTEKYQWGKQMTQKLSTRKPVENFPLKYFDDLNLPNNCKWPKYVKPPKVVSWFYMYNTTFKQRNDSSHLPSFQKQTGRNNAFQY